MLTVIRLFAAYPDRTRVTRSAPQTKYRHIAEIGTRITRQHIRRRTPAFAALSPGDRVVHTLNNRDCGKKPSIISCKSSSFLFVSDGGQTQQVTGYHHPANRPGSQQSRTVSSLAASPPQQSPGAMPHFQRRSRRLYPPIQSAGVVGSRRATVNVCHVNITANGFLDRVTRPQHHTALSLPPRRGRQTTQPFNVIMPPAFS